jgi:hypothetical protein
MYMSISPFLCGATIPETTAPSPSHIASTLYSDVPHDRPPTLPGAATDTSRLACDDVRLR